MMDDNLSVLSHSRLLKGLDEQELRVLLEFMEEKEVPARTIILHKGVVNESLFFIKAGRVRVMMEIGGDDILIAELGPGEAFGEMSFIDNFITSASVIAMESTVLLVIKKQDLNKVMNGRPTLAADFWKSVSQTLVMRYWGLLEKSYQLARSKKKS